MKKLICITIILAIALTATLVVIKNNDEEAQKMHALAVIVNNQDYSIEDIDTMAKENGFKSYDDMVEYLVSIGELVYIPEFEYTNNLGETIPMGNEYSIKGTTAYNIALEMGIITE